jgi:hypothetical protein
LFHVKQHLNDLSLVIRCKSNSNETSGHHQNWHELSQQKSDSLCNKNILGVLA